MARLATCKGCGKPLQPGEKVIHNSKSYCSDCYASIKRYSEEYKNLIEFICMNFELDKPTGIMFKQIKEFKDEFNYSYAAMTYTLWYCKEILNKTLDKKYGMGLIKYYYAEAREYYEQQERLKNQVAKLENTNVITKRIKQSSSKKNNSVSLINLEKY
ncbi:MULTISPECIES: hypothetical protein [unclassified Lacrimispora]|uniref:hypothetical protein n=1 Tax=unclassified Lacrimispora TaxID=2719232 RepID=UPI00376F7407